MTTIADRDLDREKKIAIDDQKIANHSCLEDKAQPKKIQRRNSRAKEDEELNWDKKNIKSTNIGKQIIRSAMEN